MAHVKVLQHHRRQNQTQTVHGSKDHDPRTQSCLYYHPAVYSENVLGKKEEDAHVTRGN